MNARPVQISFSDFFNIDPTVIEDYGAFDISLICDTPVFIDPFMLYASGNQKYRGWHDEIVRYLVYLRDQYADADIEDWELEEYFYFREVKNLYMGFSRGGNRGKGLGRRFARILKQNLSSRMRDFGNEKILDSGHLEKLCVIAKGVGRDFISDFTANILKRFILEYSQEFANKFLQENQRRTFVVERAEFNYELGRWVPKKYLLPQFRNEFVLLAPQDILTRNETWISHDGLLREFYRLPETVGNTVLRGRLIRLIEEIRAAGRGMSQKEKTRKIEQFCRTNPELVDWYIRDREAHKQDALNLANERMAEMQFLCGDCIRKAVNFLGKLGFYNRNVKSIEEARQKIGYFKRYVECNDGYKMFYPPKGGKHFPEEFVHHAFRLLWYGSECDVSPETNDGFGPADFKISIGGRDKCIVEIKWADNSKLKNNLNYQAEAYAKAHGTDKKLSVVLCSKASDFDRVDGVLKEIGKLNSPDIFIIDARPDKPSASNIKPGDAIAKDIDAGRGNEGALSSASVMSHNGKQN